MTSPPDSKAGSPPHKLQLSPHHSSHRRSRSRPYARSNRRLSSRSHSTSVDQKKTDAPRIVFGNDAIASLPSELNKLTLSFPLIVCSPSRIHLADRIRSLLPNLEVCFVTPDTYPGPSVLSDRDSVISVGGPRAVALARRISVKMRVPHICIPTTYSGEPGELFPPLGKHGDASGSGGSQTSDGGQGDGRGDEHQRSLPAVILYDRKLTESRVRRFSAEDGVAPDGEAEAALRAATGSADAEADVALSKPAKGSTGQWSYINLPGV
ncbi:hypothetical protein BBK36DRAFT_1169517 [Trichoderma citrinoviride]|uniref:Alcohol dehydrogenase iron-type/glycerol dehydrogenase GldA domain-containing protein n=1 Tax=Trichoderma citrinoviride TaxID=58853 RepID=A0A2T4B926_9HYPO|nr:hypothetical protein BBK36DRAFT_1169517 [Trichoderma citrinoviride]PTB65824.1 hypothetical protein BBK36DRAFT_1169517 [Trichoderma citrinoviride]